MAGKTVEVQADPDPMPVAGQRPGPPFFAVLIVAGVIVICAGLQSAASIVAPLFLVITLVITVAPLRALLVARRWPSWLASAVTLLVIYLLIGLILGSVVFAVVRLVDTLPQYASAFQQILASLLGVAERLGFGQQQIEQLASSVQPSTLAGPAQSLLSGVSGGLSLLLLIVTVVIFLAFESGTMADRLAVIRDTRPHIADGLISFGQRVRKYWIVTTIFGLIVAVLDVIGLVIIGVPLYLTWGVLAFVTNYIPNIGFILGRHPAGPDRPARWRCRPRDRRRRRLHGHQHRRADNHPAPVHRRRRRHQRSRRIPVADRLGLRPRHPRSPARHPRHLVREVVAAGQLRPRQLGERPRHVLTEEGQTSSHPTNRSRTRHRQQADRQAR